jgi:hypothetical protein
MDGLKLTDLEANKVYRCRLSGQKIWMRCIPLKFTDTQQGRVVSESRLDGMYFNQVTGLYTLIEVSDYQLEKL